MCMYFSSLARVLHTAVIRIMFGEEYKFLIEFVISLVLVYFEHKRIMFLFFSGTGGLWPSAAFTRIRFWVPVSVQSNSGARVPNCRTTQRPRVSTHIRDIQSHILSPYDEIKQYATDSLVVASQSSISYNFFKDSPCFRLRTEDVWKLCSSKLHLLYFVRG